MTELSAIEESLTASLDTMVELWPTMLHPTSSGSVARGPAGSVTLAEDDAFTDADTPRTERVLSLRRQVVDYLAALCRTVAADRPIYQPTVRCSHGTDTTVTLRWPMLGPTRPVTRCAAGRPYTGASLHSVQAGDLHDLVNFLRTHLQWFAGHEVAPTAAQALADAAAKVRGITDPYRRTHVRVGACPVKVTPEGTTDTIECGTSVRVRLGAGHLQLVRCKGCGTSDTLDGWVVRMVGQQVVTAEELVVLLHRRLGLRMTRVGIRTWKHRGLIRAVDTTAAGEDLFNFGEVAQALRVREERQNTPREEVAPQSETRGQPTLSV